MYAFAFELNGKMTFVAFGDKVFTYPTAALAQTDFQGVKDQAHLYCLDPDLSVARLLEPGNLPGAPDEFEPTNLQKEMLFKSFVYKSLLEWAPEHDENMSQV